MKSGVHISTMPHTVFEGAPEVCSKADQCASRAAKMGCIQRMHAYLELVLPLQVRQAR